MNQSEKAERFREMHAGPGILVLPNAWDAASARLIESIGFPAAATTSAGLANALGFADGGFTPRKDLAFMVRRIASTVSIPVTVDIEAGLGATTAEVLDTVRAVIEAGGVGINIEDSRPGLKELVAAAEQEDLIRSIRGLARELGIPLVINARTDALSPAVVGIEDRCGEAIRRANGYRAAGADCLFVPFTSDGAVIRRLAAEIVGPVNVLAVGGTPPVAELRAMGVRRVSVGSGLHRATMALTRRMAGDLFESGRYDSFTQDAMPYAEANALFL